MQLLLQQHQQEQHQQQVRLGHQLLANASQAQTPGQIALWQAGYSAANEESSKRRRMEQYTALEVVRQQAEARRNEDMTRVLQFNMP